MRHKLINCKKDLQNYKSLYYDAKKEICQLKSDLHKVNAKHGKLQAQVKADKASHGQWKSVIKRKCPFKDCSIPTKKTRLEDYKPFLNKILDILPQCTKSSVCIEEDGQPVQLSLCKSSDNTEITSPRKDMAKGADHNYCNNEAGDALPHPTSIESENSGIYNADGSFIKKHIRKAVLVTDNFRISNDAYHEIRSELNGHMPPVGKVKLEKSIMSEEIPYQKHPTVSLL